MVLFVGEFALFGLFGRVAFHVFLHQVVSELLRPDFGVLAESEVGQFEVSVGVEQYVVGFQVAVDILHFVDGVECEQHFRSIEECLLVGEYVFFHEQIHEVSPGQVLHHEVEVVGVLEGALQAHHPGVFFGDGEDVPLLPRLHDFVLENHLALLEFFDCHGFGGLIPLAESDLSEGALADDLDGFEVVDGELLALLSEEFGFVVVDLLFEFFLLGVGEA